MGKRKKRSQTTRRQNKMSQRPPGHSALVRRVALPVAPPRVREKILKAAGSVVSEVFPRYFDESCCINGCWVFCDVLARWGVPSRPVHVQLDAANSVMVQALEEAAARVQRGGVAAPPPAGGHLLSCGRGGDGPGYDGHVVVLSGEFLLDPTLGQFSRPAKGIPLPYSFGTTTTRAFRSGREPLNMDFDNGSRLCYHVVPDPPSPFYRELGWRRSPVNIAAARELSAALGERLTPAPQRKIG